MSSKKKHSHEEHAGNHERWLLTYADMITLLMIFFIIMYSMSIVDAKKFSSLAQSLSGVLNSGTQVLPGTGGILPDGVAKQTFKANEDKKIKAAVTEIRSLIKAHNLNAEVSVVESQNAVTVRLKENMLFDSGSADIRASAFSTLDGIAKLLGGLDNQVRIEGYTDDIPISSTTFRSNWELASQRAINVLVYLGRRGVPQQRLSAESFGEFKPLVPNTSKENRQKNRRVDIVIVRESQ